MFHLRSRSAITAWILSALLALASVATVLADNGQVPFPK
jgi:hypothetical protein